MTTDLETMSYSPGNQILFLGDNAWSTSNDLTPVKIGSTEEIQKALDNGSSNKPLIDRIIKEDYLIRDKEQEAVRNCTRRNRIKIQRRKGVK